MESPTPTTRSANLTFKNMEDGGEYFICQDKYGSYIHDYSFESRYKMKDIDNPYQTAIFRVKPKMGVAANGGIVPVAMM